MDDNKKKPPLRGLAALLGWLVVVPIVWPIKSEAHTPVEWSERGHRFKMIYDPKGRDRDKIVTGTLLIAAFVIAAIISLRRQGS